MARLTSISEIDPIPKRIYTDNLILWKVIRSEIIRLGKDADLNHMDVSEITNMFNLFFSTSFCGDVSLWDVGNVSVMEGMFAYTDFSGDISLWDTKNLKNASSMFRKSKFNSDIKGWNVGNLRYMNMMFTNSLFNHDISNWQLNKPIDMSNMFWGCEISYCMDKLAERITDITEVSGILDNTLNYKFNRDVFRKKSNELKRIANETYRNNLIRNTQAETSVCQNGKRTC